MSFWITLHGEIRWIIALVAAVAVVRFALGWLRTLDYKKFDRILMAVYTGFLDLNFLLGLILLFAFGGGFPDGFPPHQIEDAVTMLIEMVENAVAALLQSSHRIEHVVTMFIAIGVAHSAIIWRKSDEANIKFRNNLIVVVVSLLFVLVGVLRLRGGWVW